MVISSYQLCDVMRKASGFRGPDSLRQEPQEYLGLLCDVGRVRVPFEPSGVFWIPTRIPVFSDIRKPLERSSLLSQLSMRSEDTGLVIDSLRRGGDAVYFATLTKKWGVVTAWVDKACSATTGITINSIDDEYVLVLATFRTFVVPPTIG